MNRWLLSLLLLFSLPTWSAWKIDLSDVPKNVQMAVRAGTGDADLNNLTLSEVDDLIKLIHLTSQYDPVQAVEVSPGHLKILVEHRPRIQSIAFVGASEFSDAEIRRIITVQDGDVFDPQLLIQQSEALQEAYKNIGYINAEVDVEFPENQAGQIDLKVIIRPGEAIRISKLEFRMANDSLRVKIQSKVSSYENDILTESLLREIREEIEDVLKDNRAFEAVIKGPEVLSTEHSSRARIVYEITEDHTFDFDITGGQLLSSLSLDDTLELETVPLANTNLVPELTNRLRNHYVQKGYARVEISTEVQKFPENKRNKVIFKVKEGPIVKIVKFQFQGRISRDSNYYTKLLMQNASEMLKKKFYLKEDLDKALENLRKELQNQGYLLAQVISSRATYNAERDRINVTVNLDEGQLTVIKSIVFENAKAFPEAVLNEIVDLKQGQPLQLAKIEESIANLKQFYKESGYLEMLVLNERQDLVQYNEDNSQATLVYRLFEGPQVRVISIVIEGLRKTKDFVVKNELDFQEGDLLTPTKIEESISRIQRTGHFSSVDIRTLEEKTEVADRTVLIRVTEAEPGLVQAGVGVTNDREFTVRGYAGIGYRNIGGAGRGISLRADGNYNVADLKYPEYRLTVGYLEPFLLDSRYKGRVNVTVSDFVTDYVRERATATVQQTFSVEKDFTSKITGVWDIYSLARSEDTNIKGPKDRERLVIGSTGLTFDFDYRDNLARPRVGHLSRLNVEYGEPNFFGGTKTIAFVRSSASFTYYLSSDDKRFTWSNGVRYGFLQNLSDRDDGAVPFNKKGFFLGGPSTIRGFDPTRESFPSSELLELTDNKMMEQTRMYLLRSTFSYPIYGIVEGTVFYDGGQVDVDGFTRTGNPKIDRGFGYRHAAGLGILVNTPVGPLNLELGWKLDMRSGESPSVFHLSFGSF